MWKIKGKGKAKFRKRAKNELEFEIVREKNPWSKYYSVQVSIGCKSISLTPEEFFDYLKVDKKSLGKKEKKLLKKIKRTL